MKSAKMKAMVVVVGIIRERDVLGRPRKLEMLYDEEAVDVSDPANREFVTVLGDPSVFLAKKPKARG